MMSGDSQPVRSRWRELWFRVTSFSTASTVIVLIGIIIFGWIIVDAQYLVTLSFWTSPAWVHALPFGGSVFDWDALGPRAFFMGCLFWLLGMSFALLVFHAYQTVSRRRLLIFATLITTWLSLWWFFWPLQHWAEVRRAKHAIPRFEAAAVALVREWPTSQGTLPEAGEFYVPKSTPNLLRFRGFRGYPTHEDFGHEIERSDNGAILFSLNGAMLSKIEYYPDGSKPGEYTSAYGYRMVPIRVDPLGRQNWYLVRRYD
jgi:hypothetical protein